MKRSFAVLALVASAVTFAIAAAPTPEPCPLSATTSNSSTTQDTNSPENGEKKFIVNHRTGNGSYNVLCIAEPAVSAHLAHGDTGGTVPCK